MSLEELRIRAAAAAQALEEAEEEELERAKQTQTLFEDFQKEVDFHEPVIEARKKVVLSAMKDLISYSEENGIPFSIDPFENYADRAYLPSKFIEFVEKCEEIDIDRSEVLEMFAEDYRQPEWSEFEAGWTHWSASSLYC